jgi:hypothetical protein
LVTMLPPRVQAMPEARIEVPPVDRERGVCNTLKVSVASGN